MIRRALRRLRSRRAASSARAADRRTIVCPCHDATLFDLRNSWKAGYRHAETLKRATAVFMGPCQGKMCAKLVENVISDLQGGPSPHGRRPSVRPPLYPVRLGELAREGSPVTGGGT